MRTGSDLDCRRKTSVTDGTGKRFLSNDQHGHGRRKAAYTLGSTEVLERSDIVFGASRMLADLAPWIPTKKHQENSYYQPEKILDWLEEHKPVSMPW